MLLARFEKSTQELAVLCAEVIHLTEEFNCWWSVE